MQVMGAPQTRTLGTCISNTRCSSKKLSTNGRKPKGYSKGGSKGITFKYHGNYCGPGYCGGAYSEDMCDFTVAPVDQLDAICQEHDFAYTYGSDNASADLLFARKGIVLGGWKSTAASVALAGKGIATRILEGKRDSSVHGLSDGIRSSEEGAVYSKGEDMSVIPYQYNKKGKDNRTRSNQRLGSSVAVGTTDGLTLTASTPTWAELRNVQYGYNYWAGVSGTPVQPIIGGSETGSTTSFPSLENQGQIRAKIVKQDLHQDQGSGNVAHVDVCGLQVDESGTYAVDVQLFGGTNGTWLTSIPVAAAFPKAGSISLVGTVFTFTPSSSPILFTALQIQEQQTVSLNFDWDFTGSGVDFYTAQEGQRMDVRALVQIKAGTCICFGLGLEAYGVTQVLQPEANSVFQVSDVMRVTRLPCLNWL